jgi:hypothetical protein
VLKLVSTPKEEENVETKAIEKPVHEEDQSSGIPLTEQKALESDTLSGIVPNDTLVPIGYSGFVSGRGKILNTTVSNDNEPTCTGTYECHYII